MTQSSIGSEQPREHLVDFFLDVATNGVGIVNANRFAWWSGRQRITPTFWQLVLTAFQEAIKFTGQQADNYRLYLGDLGENYSFMIWNGGDELEDSWWQSVSKLAVQSGKKPRKRSADSDQETDADETA